MNTHDHLLNQSDFALASSKASINGNRSRSGSIKRNARAPIFTANSPQMPTVNYPLNGNYNTGSGDSYYQGVASPRMDLAASQQMPVGGAPNGIPNMVPQRSRTLPTKKPATNITYQQQPTVTQPLPVPQHAAYQPKLQQPYFYQNSAQKGAPMNYSTQRAPQNYIQSSPQQHSVLPQKHIDQSDPQLPYAANTPNLLRSKSTGFSLRKNKSLLRGDRSQMASPVSLSNSPMLPNIALNTHAKASPQKTQSDGLTLDSPILSDNAAEENKVNPFDSIADPANDDIASLSMSLRSSSFSQSQSYPSQPHQMQPNHSQPTQEQVPQRSPKRNVSFESLLDSIMNNKKINKTKYNCNPEVQYDIRLAKSWVEYYNLKPQQYGKINKKSLQKQELIYQLIKYQQLNSKNDKKDFWDTIGYDFLFSQDESIVFPETKAEVYDDFFGYFNTLQQLEDLCEKHLYTPLLEELNKNKSKQNSGVNEDAKELSDKVLRLFNINNICVIINTWLFKIIDTYQLYINQLIVTKFWLEMEYFKDPKSNIFLNWLNNNFKSKFPYEELISNYLIDNLRNYVNCFQKLLRLHSHKKLSTSYKKILIIVNSLQTFVNQCHSHYNNSEFKNFLSRFNWSCQTNGNIEFKWKNLKIITHNKINNTSNTIDYLILFNNCLVLCKLDIYLKEFIIKEYPLPIEFLEIFDVHNDEIHLLHKGKVGLKYTLKFSDRNLKQQWINLITETKVNYLMDKAKIDPFEMIPVSTNFVHNDVSLYHQKKLSKLQQCESLMILMALDKHKNLKNTNNISGKILCSLTMNYNNQTYHLIGTNNGLYIDDINRTGLNWKKLSGIRNVKQVEFIEPTSKLVVFTGDQLVQFDFNNIIKSILDPNYHLVGHDISNHKVFFFKNGYINGELYLFYRYLPATIKKKGLEVNNMNYTTSYFKILKLNQRKEFEIFFEFELNDINCYDIILLNDTNNLIYLSTNQGFFKLYLNEPTLDTESLNSRKSEPSRISLMKLQIIPSYLYNSANNYSLDERMFLQKIEENLKNSKPLKILETSNPNELLLTYATFGIFINRHTDLISRFDIIHFNLIVENIAFKNNSLFAFSRNCIEIFKINNNKDMTMFIDRNDSFASRHNKYLSHEQIIVAENINLIDSSSSSITVVLDHPLDPPGHQLVMQLVEKTKKIAPEETSKNTDVEDDTDSSDSDISDDESDYESDKDEGNSSVKQKKLSLDKMKIMDSNTRLPAKWTGLWDISVNNLNNSNFIERQELIYQLLKNEETLIFQAKKLHRTWGFKFLSDEVHADMIYPDTKDSIYRHTFGCLNPLVSFHEKYLLKPMLEILNLKSKEIPLYDILDLYTSWIGEANFIYLEYALRLVHSDWFFDLEKRKETSNFLIWLNMDPQQLKETLEIFLRNLNVLTGLLNFIIDNIKKSRDIDSKIEISKIEAILNQIATLRESFKSKLAVAKFNVITDALHWEIAEAKSELVKKSFLSSCVKKLVKFEEIFIKVNEGQNKIYKKKRLVMLFPNWLLITKFYKDKKYFQVIENPLPLDRIKFDYSTSDHNSINIYDFDGRILYKLSFASRNIKKEWFDTFAACAK